jgi:bifunctional DNase/RNase
VGSKKDMTKVEPRTPSDGSTPKIEVGNGAILRNKDGLEKGKTSAAPDDGKIAGRAGPKSGLEEKEVRLESVDTTLYECILNLEEINGNRTLPIWIGQGDGEAITICFSDIALPRPLTHDLLLSAIKALGYGVEKVVINDFKDNMFYARIHLVSKMAAPVNLDSRPGDAIALAVRAGCPIYVEEKVFVSAQTFPTQPTQEEAGKRVVKDEDLRPENMDAPKDTDIQSWLQDLQWRELQERKYRFKGDVYYEGNPLSSLAIDCYDAAREEKRKAAEIHEKLRRILGDPGHIACPEDATMIKGINQRALSLPDPWKDERGGFDDACFYARHPRWSEHVARLRDAYDRWRDDPRFLSEAPDFRPRNPSWEP